jgi:hypothetical protein
MTPANVMQKNIQDVVKILKSPGCRYVAPHGFMPFLNYCHSKVPVFVKSQEMAVELAPCFATEKLVTAPMYGHFNSLINIHRLCPIFLLSNVTGEGLDLVSTAIAPRGDC